MGGTASFGTDYVQRGAASFTATTGTVTFAAGSATAVVTLDPTPDSAVEPDEAVALAVIAALVYARSVWRERRR